METRQLSLRATRDRQANKAAYLFLLPVLILLVVYVFYPIIDTFRLSGYQWNGISADKKSIGFSNWFFLLKDKHFWAAFKNNIIVMIFSIVIQIPLGTALATFIEFSGKKSTIFKVVWFIPMLMSSVAIGFLFSYVLSSNGGVISTISNFFGGKNIDLLGNPQTVLYTIIGIIAWRFTPFYMVYTMAAYSGIPEEVYEASLIDGANRSQYFWKIALPLLKPALYTGAIMSMVGSLKYFDLVFVMTGGGPGTASELMATYMYRESFKTFNMGYGSTVAAGMFILISLIAIITFKLLQKNQETN
ncbi:MAG: sugar ABC transporter permease [Peptostreptococcaceae bacterium]|nr:sugar ABC transporter permease [Peptostreptococcaceae bacterium]